MYIHIKIYTHIYKAVINLSRKNRNINYTKKCLKLKYLKNKISSYKLKDMLAIILTVRLEKNN